MSWRKNCKHLHVYKTFIQTFGQKYKYKSTAVASTVMASTVVDSTTLTVTQGFPDLVLITRLVIREGTSREDTSPPT